MVDISNQRQFYGLLLNTENLFSFLVAKNLIQSLPDRCKNCHRKNCRTNFSPRNNTLFAITNSLGHNSSKLAISQIFELIYSWCVEEQRCKVITLTGISSKTLTFWFSSFINICTQHFNRREKYGKEKTVIEIDESLMRGKRKNNRGRYLQMDQWRNNAPNDSCIPSDSEDETSDSQSNGERYGNRIDVPWMVGICECSVDDEGHHTLMESRFFIVQKRDKHTLRALILQEVNLCSTIFTDEWKGFHDLRILGYNHIRINHSLKYADDDGHHTNTVVVVWHHLKAKILRNMSGTLRNLLDSSLHKQWLQSKYMENWEFVEFILVSLLNSYSTNST